MPCIIFLPKKPISFFYVSMIQKNGNSRVYFFVWQQGVYFTEPVCFYQKIAKNMFLLCFHQKIATDCFIYVCAKFNNNKFLFLFLQKGNNIFFIFLSIKVTSCFCLRYCLKTTTEFSSFRISTK